jgi:hypothetical protein
MEKRVLPEEVREYLRERAAQAQAGLRRAAEAGRQPNSATAPYGYRVVRKCDLGLRYFRAKLGQYVVIEEEAELVRLIFEEYLRTGSSAEIARSLTAMGAPRPRKGGVWSYESVLHMLRNPCYAGHAEWGRRKGAWDRIPSPEGSVKSTRDRPITGSGIAIPCPEIVDPVVFDTVQLCLGIPSSRRLCRGRAAVNLLHAFVWCGDCGERMIDGSYEPTGERVGGGYYACRRCPPREGSGSPRPRLRAFPARAVEDEVRDALCRMVPEDDRNITEGYLFSDKWRVPAWMRRQLLLMGRLSVRVYGAPWRVEVKVGGDDATPENVELLLRVLVDGVRHACEKNAERGTWEWERQRPLWSGGRVAAGLDEAGRSD